MKREVHNVLVVCTRRIGDVFLATPVIRSLKAAYPQVAIDLLVFEGTQEVVSSWSDIRRVWTIPERPRRAQHLALLRSLWRRYDLALSLLAGDRPTFYAWVAGRYRMGTLLPDKKSWWKRRLLNDWVPFDNLHSHTVTMNLRVLEPLNIASRAAPVMSWNQRDEESARREFPGMSGDKLYAVLHVSPKFSYKTWTPAGWAALGEWLTGQGFAIVVAGGISPGEQAYCRIVMQQLPGSSVNLAGQVSLPSLGFILSRASLYVGTDTAVSHMAAAVGVPTVVLFGPSNPVKWGPWPKDFATAAPSPWKTRGSQRQGNVFLIQGEGDCVPCLHEGCDRHIQSLSDCLQTLSANRVIQAAEVMLAAQTGRSHVNQLGATRTRSVVNDE